MSSYIARIDHGEPGTETENGFIRLWHDDPTEYRLARVWFQPTGVYGVYRPARWWHRMAARRRKNEQ